MTRAVTPYLCLALAAGLIACGGSSKADPTTATDAGGAPSSGGGGATPGGGDSSAFGGDSSVLGTGAVDTVDGYCSRLMALEAKFDAACTNDPLSFWTTTFFSVDVQCPRLKDAVSQGRITFDGAKSQACLNAVESALGSAECDDASTDAALKMTESVCAGLLAPNVEAGGACKSFAFLNFFPECSAGNYCDQGGTTQCVGTCAPYLASGDACDALNSGVAPCGPGLSCANKRCAPFATEGAPCRGLDEYSCGSGLYCDGATAAGQAGACHVRKSQGTCATSDECQSYLRCDTGNCVPRKKPGETCTSGARECGLLNYCSAGKCAESAPGLGDACGLIDSENVYCGVGFCDTGPFASTGVCRASKLSGEACTGTPATGECAGDYARCDPATKTCVACSSP